MLTTARDFDLCNFSVISSLVLFHEDSRIEWDMFFFKTWL